MALLDHYRGGNGPLFEIIGIVFIMLIGEHVD